MGIGIFHGSTCSYDTPTSPVAVAEKPTPRRAKPTPRPAAPEAEPRKLPNPNKFRWSLLLFERFESGFCVVVLQYHDCVNYEGKKVWSTTTATSSRR